VVDIARKNLLHDRVRFVITVVGITFSVVLILAQFGIYLGMMANASTIIDHSGADIWVTSANSANFDFALPFPERKINHVRSVPGVLWAEKLILGWGLLKKKDGGTENVEIIGFNPDSGVGAPWSMRKGAPSDVKLARSIIVDETDERKLGGLRVGDQVELLGSKVKVVGLSSGIKGFATAPFVFTSYRTAQEILSWYGFEDQTVFILVKVAPGYDVASVAEALRAVKGVDIYTRGQYSLKTRLYWTIETGMGFSFGLTILMGIVVGMVIVGQTIYTATVQHLREFGTLKAIGAGNRDIYGIIFKQALTNAVIGYALGLAIVQGIIRGYVGTGMTMLLPPALMVGVFVLTVVMCLGASAISVRKALRVDPAIVFRS
jgi:putative ABC transport system permease protein